MGSNLDGPVKDTGLGYTKLDFLQKYPFTSKKDKILKKYQLVKPVKVWTPTRQDWNTPNKITNPDIDLWFIEGLGINNCFGAVVYGPMYNNRESIPMGSLHTVFSASVTAIMRYAELLVIKNMAMRRIYICSDCMAAIAALAKTTTESAFIWECMQALEKLSEST
jgi:hypothetical protein